MNHLRKLSAAVLLVLAGPTLADTPPAEQMVVPFERLMTGHMAITIKVNGKGPYRVIFDTGAPVSLLNNKVAKESGLLKDMPKPAFSLFGNIGQAKIKTLEIGGLIAKDIACIVMDHPTVSMISKSPLGPIEGIIGFPFFARYKMTLDYQAKELTFVPNGYDPPDVMDSMMKTMMSLMNDTKPAPRVLAPTALLGLRADKMTEDEDDGVTINEVFAGSPAAAAGLKRGDRLLTLDSRWTDNVKDLFSAAGYLKPGVEVKATIKREDKEMEVTLKPRLGI